MNFSQLFFFNKLFVALFLVLTVSCQARVQSTNKNAVQRVDPPNWWVGFEQKQLELTLYGQNIQQYDISLGGMDTKIVAVTRPSNKNYLFVTIEIGQNQASGILKFNLRNAKSGSTQTLDYPLLERTDKTRGRGVSPKDLVYLIFPDRFANGDERNDVFPTMKENTVDRKALKGRHGGDLQGIINHLDYLDELGVTALWINPVLENNQPRESYHGYAATDLYKVDPRFGNNELYKRLSALCHEKGIRLIWDVVYNHWGNENWMYKDLPDSSWVHWYKEFTRTNYRAETLMDPYASNVDRDLMTNAWFDHHMPDLNQQNPQLANYLIQNSIWWIEYAGLDAFRIDTYAYPDQEFMKSLNEAVLREYPDFVLFGETWVQGSPIQAWFTRDNGLNKKFSSELHGVTDFQLYYAITKGLNEPSGWEEGFARIELTLAHDLLYDDPYLNVTFLDNHDLSRAFSVFGEDVKKFKMALALMYTLRGIPSIYYGTEIAMKNFANPDALVREDFPGGWKGDAKNKFIKEGRTEMENEVFDFCKSLGQWRKKNAWIGNSRLVQFVPQNNTYVYFRLEGNNKVMCVYNSAEEEAKLDTKRYSECIGNSTSASDVFSGQSVEISNGISVPAKSFLILQF